MGIIANNILFDWINIKFQQRPEINSGVEQCRELPDAVLIDVREAKEYHSGHIPGAINIPLSEIQKISLDKEKPLFLYCLRGSRSNRAAKILIGMGYKDVRSIGGINRYKGSLK